MKTKQTKKTYTFTLTEDAALTHLTALRDYGNSFMTPSIQKHHQALYDDFMRQMINSIAPKV